MQLAGYFAKTTSVPPGWALPGHVVEVCSVSTCMGSAPPDWIDSWLHNELGLFNCPADALAVLPRDPAGFQLFAYGLERVRYVHGIAESQALPELPISPLPSSFEAIGFDIVSRSCSHYFECSPLSCNAMALETHVNRFCLVDERARAEGLAERFSLEEPEPGPFHVVEVWRDRSQPAHLPDGRGSQR